MHSQLKGRTRLSLGQGTAVAVAELYQAAQGYLEPLLASMPDKRLRVVGV